MGPLKAVRVYCLECTCGSAVEVKVCPTGGCILHQYRMGKNPSVGSRFKLQMIRLKCLDCSESSSDVKYCSYTDCSLYKFRMGKNPNMVLSDERRKQLSEAAKYINECKKSP